MVGRTHRAPSDPAYLARFSMARLRSQSQIETRRSDRYPIISGACGLGPWVLGKANPIVLRRPQVDLREFREIQDPPHVKRRGRRIPPLDRVSSRPGKPARTMTETGHQRQPIAGKVSGWPSNRGPISKIRPSNGCKGDVVPLALGQWYDFHEVGCHPGNVG